MKPVEESSDISSEDGPMGRYADLAQGHGHSIYDLDGVDAASGNADLAENPYLAQAIRGLDITGIELVENEQDLNFISPRPSAAERTNMGGILATQMTAHSAGGPKQGVKSAGFTGKYKAGSSALKMTSRAGKKKKKAKDDSDGKRKRMPSYMYQIGSTTTAVSSNSPLKRQESATSEGRSTIQDGEPHSASTVSEDVDHLPFIAEGDEGLDSGVVHDYPYSPINAGAPGPLSRIGEESDLGSGYSGVPSIQGAGSDPRLVQGTRPSKLTRENLGSFNAATRKLLTVDTQRGSYDAKEETVGDQVLKLFNRSPDTPTSGQQQQSPTGQQQQGARIENPFNSHNINESITKTQTKSKAPPKENIYGEPVFLVRKERKNQFKQTRDKVALAEGGNDPNGEHRHGGFSQQQLKDQGGSPNAFGDKMRNSFAGGGKQEPEPKAKTFGFFSRGSAATGKPGPGKPPAGKPKQDVGLYRIESGLLDGKSAKRCFLPCLLLFLLAFSLYMIITGSLNFEKLDPPYTPVTCDVLPTGGSISSLTMTGSQIWDMTESTGVHPRLVALKGKSSSELLNVLISWNAGVTEASQLSYLAIGKGLLRTATFTGSDLAANQIPHTAVHAVVHLLPFALETAASSISDKALTVSSLRDSLNSDGRTVTTINPALSTDWGFGTLDGVVSPSIVCKNGRNDYPVSVISTPGELNVVSSSARLTRAALDTTVITSNLEAKSAQSGLFYGGFSIPVQDFEILLKKFVGPLLYSPSPSLPSGSFQFSLQNPKLSLAGFVVPSLLGYKQEAGEELYELMGQSSDTRQLLQLLRCSSSLTARDSFGDFRMTGLRCTRDGANQVSSFSFPQTKTNEERMEKKRDYVIITILSFAVLLLILTLVGIYKLYTVRYIDRRSISLQTFWK